MKRFLTATLFFLLLIAAWHWIHVRRFWSPVLVPSPESVGRYLWEIALDGSLWSSTAVTMKRLVAGYMLGLLAGLPLGFLTARVRAVRDTLGVLALGLQGLPSVCWVPLALLWFGQTEGAMLFVVLMGTLWSVILATETGVRNVNPLYIRAART